MQSLEQDYRSKSGAAHMLLLWNNQTDGTWSHAFNQIIPENKVNIVWQLPQYVVVSIAEILISVSGSEFSYSQAAPSMRSVMQAVWLLTISFGAVLAMGISGSHVIKQPATEFFFYAGLMAAVMGVFIVLSTRYQYVEEDKWIDDHDQPKDSDNISLTESEITTVKF